MFWLYTRPRASHDTPFSESIFATYKVMPVYLANSFERLGAAQ